MSRRDDRIDDTALGRVLRDVGRGPTLSPTARARIYQDVRARWAETVSVGQPRDRRTRRAFGMWFAVAAALTGVAILAVFLRAPTGGSGEAFATLSRMQGVAAIERDGQTLRPDADGFGVLRVGDRVRTDSASRLALELASGQLLRVDERSSVFVAAPTAIELAIGTVYFDSQGMDSEPFAVATAIGSVAHVGTQYEASISAARLRVRVREGTASVDAFGRAFEAPAGEQLQINPEGDVIRGEFAPDDPAWQWAEDLAVIEFADAYNLFETLEWISREIGVALTFEDADTEARARSIELTGLAGFNPREALEAIRSATEFSYRLGERRLLVVANTP